MELIEDDFDIAIRTWTEIPNTSLYKIDLLQLKPVLVASPKYIEHYGEPKNIDDLREHKLLVFKKEARVNYQWTFVQEKLSIKGHLYSNDYLNILAAAKAGVGIANMYSCICQADIDSGKLVVILPEDKQKTTKISMIYRQKKETSAKLESFLTFVKNALGEN